MNAAKKALVRSKNFVATHKTPIAIIATAAVTAVVVTKMKMAPLEEAYEFIKDQGLQNEFVDFTRMNTVN